MNLSGIALQEDELIQERKDIVDLIEQRACHSAADEALEEIIHNVKSPTPPPPDMRNPETFK